MIDYVLAKDTPTSDPIYQYSNPQKVYELGQEDDIPIYRSFKENKKYMVNTGKKWLHFGQMGYEDYTKHKDEQRRKAFLKRNHKWAKMDADTPAWLSYHYLW